MRRLVRTALIASIACALTFAARGTALAQDAATGTGSTEAGAAGSTATGAAADADESMQAATTAEGDMDDERARGHFRLGRQLYEAGRFHDAGVEFERAFGLSGRAQLLFNAYLAYRDAQDDVNALRTLRGYLTGVSDVPDREHLEARLAALDARVTQEQERQAQADSEADRARMEAEEAQRQLAVARAEPVRSRPLWPWAIAATGGAALIGAAIVGGLTAADAGSLRADCTNGECNREIDLEGRRSAIQSMAVATDVLWIGGVALAAAGVILALALPDDLSAPAEQVTLVPSVMCGSDGCVAAIEGSF